MRKITSSMPTSDGDPEDMEGIGTGGAAKAIKGDVQLSTQDLESIEQAARDYIEGWFEADSERLRSCLHPDLAKRTVDFDREQRSWVLRQVDFTRFINSTAGTQIPPDSRGYEITTLDTHRNIAIVKVVSMPFVDYLQVARFDRRWQIVNVLWERREE